MRISVSSRRPWRISSCPTACGIRCVNPSSATVCPSPTSSRTASARLTISAISEGERVRPALDRDPAQLRELVDSRLSAEAPEAGVLHPAERHLRLVPDRLVGPVHDARLPLLRGRGAAVGGGGG